MRTFKVLSISVPPRLFRQVEKLAKKENRTKSELLREAIRQYIEAREWSELKKYGAQQAAKLAVGEGDVEQLIDDVRK